MNLYSDGLTLEESRAVCLKILPRLDGPERAALNAVLARVHDCELALEVGRRMREAQRAYFRSKSDLPGCKALEARFDALAKGDE